MPDQTVNIPLLRKAVEWAEAEARLDEGAWYQGNYVEKFASCGTAYCVAGWVLHQDGWSDEAIDAAAHEGNAPVAAAALLGIPISDDGDRSPLFEATNSIEDVRRIAEDIAGERL